MSRGLRVSGFGLSNMQSREVQAMLTPRTPEGPCMDACQDVHAIGQRACTQDPEPRKGTHRVPHGAGLAGLVICGKEDARDGAGFREAAVPVHRHVRERPPVGAAGHTVGRAPDAVAVPEQAHCARMTC